MTYCLIACTWTLCMTPRRHWPPPHISAGVGKWVHTEYVTNRSNTGPMYPIRSVPFVCPCFCILQSVPGLKWQKRLGGAQPNPCVHCAYSPARPKAHLPVGRGAPHPPLRRAHRAPAPAPPPPRLPHRGARGPRCRSARPPRAPTRGLRGKGGEVNGFAEHLHCSYVTGKVQGWLVVR